MMLRCRGPVPHQTLHHLHLPQRSALLAVKPLTLPAKLAPPTAPADANAGAVEAVVAARPTVTKLARCNRLVLAARNRPTMMMRKLARLRQRMGHLALRRSRRKPQPRTTNPRAKVAAATDATVNHANHGHHANHGKAAVQRVRRPKERSRDQPQPRHNLGPKAVAAAIKPADHAALKHAVLKHAVLKHAVLKYVVLKHAVLKHAVRVATARVAEPNQPMRKLGRSLLRRNYAPPPLQCRNVVTKPMTTT